MELEAMGRMPTNLLDRKNWIAADYWYKVGDFRAFWDRSLKLWTIMHVDAEDNQIDTVEYFNNKDHYQHVAAKWGGTHTEATS